MEMKICSKCGIKKEVNKENFNIAKANKGGLTGRCRQCTIEYNKQYRKENIEKIHSWNKKHSDANKDKIKNQRREYIKNNKSKVAELTKQCRIRNKEKDTIYYKNYYIENKETINLKAKITYETNLEKFSNRMRVYNCKNKDQSNLRTQKRRSLKKQLESTLTLNQWNQIKLHFDNKCAYCGETKKLTQEHFIPVTKGGEYTLNNIIPACQSCNSSKNNKDFFEFYPNYKYYSKERETNILNFINI